MVRGPQAASEPLLVEGRNCWRRARASRLAFLVDGAAYFAAFQAAVARARHQVLVLAWDFNSRVRLRGGAPGPDALGAFLESVVARRGGPEAYVLDWDFAMIYAFERERFPVFRLDWRTHRRLHFRLDGTHPPGASHHQKVVVVDDATAFVGGFDLARSRWDTPAHRADDPERVNEDGRPYAPFHDVQVVVEGEAAAALGDLCRERWRRATGRRLDPPRSRGDAWPPEVAPDLEDVVVAIARTEPEWGGRPGVREVETLYLDAIAAARRHIYVENQYLSSGRISAALAERLLEPNGPDVVIVVPQRCSGWFEEATMGVTRARLLERLERADRHGRLRVYYPVVPGLAADTSINVHSKILVADETLLRLGSANASNRSMRLDTECDLAVEAAGDPRVEAAIGRFRDRLLAEHLGVAPEAVSRAVAAQGSLAAGVESLRGGERTLVALDVEPDVLADHVAPDSDLLDPEKPIAAEILVERFLPVGPSRPWSRWPHAALAVALLVVLAAGAWRSLGTGERGDLEAWLHWARALEGGLLAPVVVTAAFIAGGAVLVPVVLLVSATGYVFGPLAGFVYALAGMLGSSCLFYGLGRWLGRDLVRRLAGSYANAASRKLARHGMLAVAAVRLAPIAPSTVVDLLAGAVRVRFRDFFFGTLAGTAPGTLLLVVLGDRLGATVRDPGPVNLLLVAGLALVLASAWAWRRLRSRRSARRAALARPSEARG